MGIDPTRQPRRRQFLKATGGAVTAVGLAGCTGGTGGDGGDGGDGGGDGGDGGGGGGDGGGAMFESFDDLVAQAEEEGEINVFASASGMEPVDQEFMSEYDIEIKRSRQGSKEVANRVIQGATSGSQRVDLGAITLVPFLQRMGEEDALATAPQVVQDELEDVTIWHQDNTVAEAFVKRNLLWMHNDTVDPEPTTWEEIVSGDYVLSVNNEDPELLLAYEQAFGAEEARNMIRQAGEAGTLTTSHGSAGKGTAKGEYEIGLLMHKFMKLPWGENLYWTPKTYKGDPIPMTAVTNYIFKPAGSPNTAASWLFFTWLCKNQARLFEELAGADREYSDMGQNHELPQTWYAPAEGHATFEEDPNVVMITYEMGPQLAEYLTEWKDLLGVKSA